MVSAFDEDTNQDSIINKKDQRRHRFYHFDKDSFSKTVLIPQNYSVQRSSYEATNDLIIVYAQLDENENGKQETEEPVHIFWIDLKTPRLGVRIF